MGAGTHSWLLALKPTCTEAGSQIAIFSILLGMAGKQESEQANERPSQGLSKEDQQAARFGVAFGLFSLGLDGGQLRDEHISISRVKRMKQRMSTVAMPSRLSGR